MIFHKPCCCAVIPRHKDSRCAILRGRRALTRHSTARHIFSISKRRVFRARSSTLRAWVLPCRKRRRGFLARMLPCEKSVGGIPTRRTLSLQPCCPRRRIAASVVVLLFLLLLFAVFSRPRSTRRTKRPGETIVSEERERRPEQHESPRTTVERPSSTIDRARRDERTNEGRNERPDATQRDATQLSRTRCSPAANM